MGVSAGSYKIVRFEPALIAIIDEVHAGIDAVVLHPRVARNISVPLGRNISDQIVAFAGLRLERFDIRVLIRPH
jgi:hypothetical protein